MTVRHVKRTGTPSRRKSSAESTIATRPASPIAALVAVWDLSAFTEEQRVQLQPLMLEMLSLHAQVVQLVEQLHRETDRRAELEGILKRASNQLSKFFDAAPKI